MIVLTDQSYVVGLWFAQIPPSPQNRPGDILACVYRDHRDAEHNHVRWRVRWYNDGRAFGSSDDKEWFGVDDATEDKAVTWVTASLRDVAEEHRLATGLTVQVEEHFVRGGLADVFALNLPWFHVQVAAPGKLADC